jgi:hypothetical protein
MLKQTSFAFNTQSIACAFCAKAPTNLHHAETTTSFRMSPKKPRAVKRGVYVAD